MPVRAVALDDAGDAAVTDVMLALTWFYGTPSRRGKIDVLSPLQRHRLFSNTGLLSGIAHRRRIDARLHRSVTR